MPTSAVEIHVPNAESVTITEDALTVELSDGRTPFRRLHTVQDRARFSMTVWPPCFSAMT